MELLFTLLQQRGKNQAQALAILDHMQRTSTKIVRLCMMSSCARQGNQQSFGLPHSGCRP